MLGFCPPTLLNPHLSEQKGGNAEAVDYQGVLNTAQACVELGVPRLVVISRYICAEDAGER